MPSVTSHCVSIMKMCQAFADAGHDVALSGWVNPRNGADPVAFNGLRGGFRVCRVPLGPVFDNPLARRLLVTGASLAIRTRSLIKEMAPDVVYSRLTLSELLCVPRRIPIVYEMHSLRPLRGSAIERAAFKILVRQKTIRRIVATTDALKASLQTELSDVEVVVARLSAEPPVAIPADQLRAFREERLQGRQFRWHVGYTGQLDTTGLRGTQVICDAAVAMPDVAFHVIGGDPSVVDYWRQRAHRPSGPGNIFFYGYHPPPQMPLFLGCFDLVLAPLQYRPSRRAPQGAGMSPLKIAQYLSYGKAIVASDIPAHRELVRDGETARLVDPADPGAWPDAIRLLLRNQPLREGMGRCGRAFYEAELTPDRRVRTILTGL